MIGSQPFLLNILFVWLWLGGALAQNQTISPECRSSCGGVEIPYPFGVGEGCYKDKGFEIICNSTNSSSLTPYLGVSGFEVLNISLDDSQLSISVSSTRKYFNKISGEVTGTDTSFNFSPSSFTVSNYSNRLYGIGCDIFAHITDLESHKYLTGCVSLCPNGDDTASSNECSGIGCCETTIPSGIKAFNQQVDSINASNSDGFGYAIVQELGGNITQNYISLLLDWRIENETLCVSCQDENSWCIETITGDAYNCYCRGGFTGNPYIPNGCQDINECGNKTQCVEEARCVNLQGYYRCDCPSGSNGDGRTTGVGCRPNGSSTRYILIGLAAGVGFLVLLAVGFLLLRKLKERKQIMLKQKFFKQNGGLLLEQQVSSGEGNIEKTKIFVSKELEKATDNFNESRILGRGGSGTVYKGMLSDGRIVAIKKSKVVDENQIGQFINELVLLSQINHRHVVQLFGCCLETEVPLLAYEFVSNGTLSHHLHDEACKSSLSWDDRLRIATEIAGALSYMHSSATTPIFHRDIKSSNILLDENLKAKVSDFGISRSVSCENTHLTTLVQGTFGYLDPEYFHSSQFTDKSDVYSFGVVLVELLTGQKPISSTRPEEDKNLVMHFISLVKENKAFQILETRVLNEGRKEDLLAVAKLAKRCLKLVGKKRPKMREVTVELERLRQVEEQQCTAQTRRDINYEDTKYWRYDSSSVSISMSGPESEYTELIGKGAT